MVSAKKVLIIGCSFSSGSYETRISGKLGDPPRDELISSIGWYDHLEVLKDRKIDVYSMPGLGWLAYAHFVACMKDSGTLSDYDLIIIQETFEPRFSVLGNQFMSEFFESPTESDRTMDIRHLRYRGSPSTMMMTCNPHDGVSFYKDFVSSGRDAHSLPSDIANRFNVDMAASSFVGSLLRAGQNMVTDMVTELGIKVMVVSFDEPSMRCAEYIDQGPVNVIHSIYSSICLHSRDEYLTAPSRGPETYAGRLTLNGNRLLGMRFDHLFKRLLQS